MVKNAYRTKLNVHTYRNLAQQCLIYNGALLERIDCYRETSERIRLYDQRGSLTIRRVDA